jgi:hypothetical protein
MASQGLDKECYISLKPKCKVQKIFRKIPGWRGHKIRPLKKKFGRLEKSLAPFVKGTVQRDGFG